MAASSTERTYSLNLIACLTEHLPCKLNFNAVLEECTTVLSILAMLVTNKMTGSSRQKKNNNCSLSFLKNKISTALGTGSNKKYILYTY